MNSLTSFPIPLPPSVACQVQKSHDLTLSPFLGLAYPIFGSNTGAHSLLTLPPGIVTFLQPSQHHPGSTISIFLGNVLYRSPVSEGRAGSLESFESQTATYTGTKTPKQKKSYNSTSLIATQTSKEKCPACAEPYKVYRCERFKTMSIQESFLMSTLLTQTQLNAPWTTTPKEYLTLSNVPHLLRSTKLLFQEILFPKIFVPKDFCSAKHVFQWTFVPQNPCSTFGPEMPYNSTISRMSGCPCRSFGKYVDEGGAEITAELEFMNSCNCSGQVNYRCRFARNCAIQLSNKFGLKELKQVINKIVYPNLFNLLQVALVLPTSSASCERSFSAMRRIKS
ncbi:hypothetical protein QTP88_026359 [Uroleucon formosanum]